MLFGALLCADFAANRYNKDVEFWLHFAQHNTTQHDTTHNTDSGKSAGGKAVDPLVIGAPGEPAPGNPPVVGGGSSIGQTNLEGAWMHRKFTKISNNLEKKWARLRSCS